MRILLMALGPSDREKKQYIEQLFKLLRSCPDLALETVSLEDAWLADFSRREGAPCLVLPEGTWGKSWSGLKLLWKLRSRTNPWILLSFDQESLALALRLAGRQRYLLPVYVALGVEPPRLKNAEDKMRLIRAVLAGSNTAAAHWAAQGFTAPIQRTVRGAPDPALYFSKSPVRKDKKIFFVCSDSLEAGRGYETLLRALKYIYEDKGMPPWELRVAGGGSLFEALLNQAREAGVEGRLAIFGPEHRADILRGGDIFIAPAEADEGGGLAFKEGWAAGLAVLASDTATHLELVRDGVNGRCFKSGDPESLAGGMRELALDKKLRRALAKGGQGSLSDFDGQNMLRQYLEIFKAIH